MKYLACLVWSLQFVLALAVVIATALVELLGVCLVAGSLPASWGRWGQLGFVLVTIPASFLFRTTAPPDSPGAEAAAVTRSS